MIAPGTECVGPCRRTPYPVPWLSVPLPSALHQLVLQYTIDTVVTIVFSNTVRAERSEDRHRMTPIGVLRQYTTAALNDKNVR